MTDPLPLIPGHTEGWRVWRVIARDDRPLLQSLVFPFMWLPGRSIDSWCGYNGDTPCVIHKCGVHAYYSRDRARRYGESYSRVNRTRCYVLGRIAGAGRVVEHEQGWRSARAAVLSIDEVITGRDVGHVGAEILARLRSVYRLGVTLEV